MATTEEFLLNNYGVTMKVARDFILDNISDLTTVFNTCKQFGVNNDMIADILANDFPDLSGGIVSSFFDSNGFTGSLLGFTNPTTAGKDLDLSNLNNYNSVILYENVSKVLIDGITSSALYNFSYGDASTWNGLASLGFTDVTNTAGYEIAYNSQTVGIGVDMTAYNNTIESVLSPYADLNGVDTVSGNYDLVLAI